MGITGKMPCAQHYQLVCPECREVTESCGCRSGWHNRYTARIPCKTCTAKLAIVHDKFKFANRGPRRS